MGHIRFASDVGAPVDVAFAYAADHAWFERWMYGVTSVQPLGTPKTGLGSSYRLDARIMSALPVPTTCEVTEFRRDAVIAYTLRGRICGTVTLRFDPLGFGTTVLTIEADYPQPVGVLARMCRRITDASAKSALRRTETRLRREIEEFHGTDLVGRMT
ncbi:SRPBCC family protein [Nocardia camponoti]|uniref:SRPBCC family protein n=1 Tax=Nocardia camponoti TaxID=1616106 RepID=A0A917QK60_9NOCA|nr:SRPBCC family protein [Nocardia camponoti]GGK54279.1 hypothetical protein GCM10011591_27570 [Nocardia camponoti]